MYNSLLRHGFLNLPYLHIQENAVRMEKPYPYNPMSKRFFPYGGMLNEYANPGETLREIFSSLDKGNRIGLSLDYETENSINILMDTFVADYWGWLA